METFYLFLVLFLGVLAVFDLSVGVSNDAVNFLNASIGSKAASFRVIMIVAATGILVGAALSNGMMDIARHGIYQPQYFYFSEIMIILVAVMLTDVVLLDIFNSLGMPTSTTVSLGQPDEYRQGFDRYFSDFRFRGHCLYLRRVGTIHLPTNLYL